MMRIQGVVALALCLVMLLLGTGCAKTVQFRMAEPMVMYQEPRSNKEKGELDPPEISFHKRGGFHSDSAEVAWANPDVPVDNHVNLHYNAEYRLMLRLPENFEFRRMQLLQGKAETLYQAIGIADDKLREYTRDATKLLSDEARAEILDDCADLKAKIEEAKIAVIRATTDDEKAGLASEFEGLTKQLLAREAVLREDDIARDSLISPSAVESLVNQMEDWRAELNQIKARIVALELMVQNVNEPYPRIIRGSVETFDETLFTKVGAIPFEIEDEYLDWIREDKVVTIVSYDPHAVPEDEVAALRSSKAPQKWPRGDLMVIEYTDNSTGVPRHAHGGTRASTHVSSRKYFNVSSTTYHADSEYERTYLNSQDGRKMWAFGPDLTPPANLEVWLQNEAGLPAKKLYPLTPRSPVDEVSVRQLAGVEGGAFDPVLEATRRGQIIAITRLGNIRKRSVFQKDHKEIRDIHHGELERAKARALVAN